MKKSSGKALAVTLPYLGFMLTDGAIRMLVLFTFYKLGYGPFKLASLFLLYELAGVGTNLFGGWLGARIGLEKLLLAGLVSQIVAMGMLSVQPDALGAFYVMASQGLSGIAKDLVKVSSKSSLKYLTPQGADGMLFRWVSLLTGSKNALKGVGFFVGGLLMSTVGLQVAVRAMASLLIVALLIIAPQLPRRLGVSNAKPAFKQILSKTAYINILSGARFFMFGSRDVWFVVGLPLYLQQQLNWTFESVGAFLALWTVGYGLAQTTVPKYFNSDDLATAMGSHSVARWTTCLIVFPAGISLALHMDWNRTWTVLIGLLLYGVVFAVNSIVHSYLVLAYSDHNKASADVGFYYMANAGGRLAGILLSGWAYQHYGIHGCLWASVLFVACSGLVALGLPDNVGQA